MPFHRIEMDVLEMFLVVRGIANSMIGKTSLPDFEIGSEFLLCSVRETTLDELESTLQGDLRRDQEMEVIGHEDEFVEEIGLASISEKSFEEETSPWLHLEERAALPRLRGDKVRLRVVGGVLARGFQNLPSGAKARFPISPLRHG